MLDADAPALARAQRSGVVLTPSGRRVPLDDEGAEVIELTEQGFYELRGAAGDRSVGRRGQQRRPGRGGPDADGPEGNRRGRDRRTRPATAAAAAGVPLTPEAQEKNQRLWWYLLVLESLLLGADTLVSNRLSKA